MSLVVVAGRQGIGRHRLVSEVVRRPVSGPSAVLHVRNKYFDLDVTLLVCELSGEPHFEEILARATGLIVIVDMHDTPFSSIPWMRFPSSLSFRALLHRTPCRNDKRTIGWQDECLQNYCEYIEFEWTEESFVPRAGAESMGLLHGDLCGSERIVQLLHNVRYESSGANSLEGGLRDIANRVLLISEELEDGNSLLRRIGNLSGEAFCISNKYFTADAAVKAMPLWYFSCPAMIDIVSANETYMVCIFVSVSSDSLCSNVQQVMLCVRAQSPGCTCIAVFSPGDSVAYANSIFSSATREWCCNNNVELVSVSPEDSGQIVDPELGTAGIARLRELLDLVEWPQQQHTNAKKDAKNTLAFVAVGGRDVHCRMVSSVSEALQVQRGLCAMKLSTQYFDADLAISFHSLPSAALAAALVPHIARSHGIVFAIDSSEHSKTLIKQILKNQNVTERTEVKEEVDERFTAVAMLDPIADEDNTVRKFCSICLVELIEMANDAARLRELVESCCWPALHLKNAAQQASTVTHMAQRSCEATTSDSSPKSVPTQRSAVLAEKPAAVSSTAEATSNALEASDDTELHKKHSCALPPTFFVNPETMKSEHYEYISMEEMTRRMQLLRHMGSRLGREERERQAAFFASRFGDEMFSADEAKQDVT